MCSLVEKNEILRFTVEDENGMETECVSAAEVAYTVCQGACPSSEGPGIQLNGNTMKDKV